MGKHVLILVCTNLVSIPIAPRRYQDEIATTFLNSVSGEDSDLFIEYPGSLLNMKVVSSRFLKVNVRPGCKYSGVSDCEYQTKPKFTADHFLVRQRA